MTDNTPVVANTTPVESVSPSPDVQTVAPSDVTQAVTPAVDPATIAPAADTSESEHKSRASERIQDLIAERKAATEYAEFWRGKAMEVINQSKAPSKEPVVTAPRIAPTPDQYGFDQMKFSRAQNEWLAEQTNLQVSRALEQRQQQEQQQTVMDFYISRVEEFRKEHPDFDLVTSNPKLPSLDRVAAAMVLSSEQSAELTYHLASRPEEATRIARLNPTQQALAVGRLEAQLRTPVQKPVATTPVVQSVAPAPVPVTNAPPPPAPIPSGGNPSISPEGMEIRDWMKMRADEAKSRRGKYG